MFTMELNVKNWLRSISLKERYYMYLYSLD